MPEISEYQIIGLGIAWLLLLCGAVYGYFQERKKKKPQKFAPERIKPDFRCVDCKRGFMAGPFLTTDEVARSIFETQYCPHCGGVGKRQ